MKRFRKGPGGFTLLEMLIVIGIIVFLFTLVAVVALRMRDKARTSRTKSVIKRIHVIMDAYKAIWREYPAGVVNPLYPDQWPSTNVMATIYQGVPLDRTLVYRGTTLEEGAFQKDDFDAATQTYFVDPWGNSLRYRKLSADRMLVWSYGPYGKDEIGIGMVWDPKAKIYNPGTGGGEQEQQGSNISMLDVDY